MSFEASSFFYYKLERIRNAIASQIVINYYKLARICSATASQFVINYYKLARICKAFAFQFVIKYYELSGMPNDMQRTTLETQGERSWPLNRRFWVTVDFDILIINITQLTLLNFYFKLERICSVIAYQFIINYYNLAHICNAIASRIVINYYKLERICNAIAS